MAAKKKSDHTQIKKSIRSKKEKTHEQQIEDDMTLAKRDADFTNAGKIVQAHERGLSIKHPTKHVWDDEIK